MTIEILRARDCIKGSGYSSEAFHSSPGDDRHLIRDQIESCRRKGWTTSVSAGKVENLKQKSFVEKPSYANLVMEQVTILKRGEQLKTSTTDLPRTLKEFVPKQKKKDVDLMGSEASGATMKIAGYDNRKSSPKWRNRCANLKTSSVLDRVVSQKSKGMEAVLLDSDLRRVKFSPILKMDNADSNKIVRFDKTERVSQKNSGFLVGSDECMSPEPDMVGKQVQITEFYAGYNISPPPDSVPIPRFGIIKKKKVLPINQTFLKESFQRILDNPD